MPADRHSAHDALDPHAALRAAKMRVTNVRLGVLRVLASTTRALNAQEVERLLDADATDRVTVYRTLNSFVDAGLAHRVDPGDRVFRFGLTDHARCTPGNHAHDHPHVVCDTCGRVECLDNAVVVLKPSAHASGSAAPRSPRAPAPASRNLRDSQNAPARRTRSAGAASFRISQQNVLLHGTCDTCER